MKNVTLNVPDERADEFVGKLAELMKECGATITETGTGAEKYSPEDGEFVAFEDETNIGEPFIGIFSEWYNGSEDKIVCYAHINGENVLEDEEEYWNAETLRPATEEEKELLRKALAKTGKRWDADEMEFVDCPTYEAIRTFEDAMLATGITFPIDERTMSYLGADVVAYMKLRVIVAAINGLSETTLHEFPKFTVNERRYYPWFVLYTQKEIDAMDEDDRRRVVGRASNNAFASGGCVYADALHASSYSYTDHGARLAFKDRERAEYAGRQFAELWADLYFIPRETAAE
ncbi:MAG: hypothetical protein IJ550_02200 [Bacteroidaceae bacterium]|nr:hypothetical protein [Bacteroidaceae bacterium]